MYLCHFPQASVAAAPVAGRVVAFGSATAAVAAPYWSVDLGSAVPLVWVEVTAHPTAADGQGLLVSGWAAEGALRHSCRVICCCAAHLPMLTPVHSPCTPSRCDTAVIHIHRISAAAAEL